MNTHRLHILLVDDDEDDYIMARDLLREIEGLDVDIDWLPEYNAALSSIRGNHYDVCLLDYRLGERNGLEFLREAAASECEAPIILLTGQSDRDTDMEAMRLGAADFLIKNRIDASALERSIRYSIERKRSQHELAQAYEELKSAQAQILQREKMASIGQLAAGVAHEINNPMGFISSNLSTLSKYVEKLTSFIHIQSTAADFIDPGPVMDQLRAARSALKLDYIVKDINELIAESLEGADRVKKIVQNLKSFSRVDESEYQTADINECIESALNIAWNELKYKAAVEKDYGDLPRTRCYPQQLNQVFLNLLVNASHAIEKQGVITIRTWSGDSMIYVSVSDTGCGIPAGILGRIFEPFYTTKEVGKGTGLGLSISYDIVKKHDGDITVESEPGSGTAFLIAIPVNGEKTETLSAGRAGHTLSVQTDR